MTNPYESIRDRIAPKKPTVEWVVPGLDDPLRQCDVLMQTQKSIDRLSGLYVVLTADCDLAHQKHFGKVLCLPVVNLTDYVNNFRFPKIVKKTLDASLAKMIDRCLTAIKLTQMTYDKDKVIDWITEDGIDAFYAAIMANLNDSKSSRKAEHLLDEIKTRWSLAQIETAQLTLNESLEILQKIRHLDKPDDDGEWAWTQWKNEIKSLVSGNSPKDISILAELAPDLGIGYVIMHRFPEIILDSDIDINPHEPKEFRRISRIVDPYARNIVNQFGQLFSSVGIPDEQISSVQIAGEIAIEEMSRSINEH